MIQVLGDGEELVQLFIGKAASQGVLKLIDQLEVLVAQSLRLLCQADLFLSLVGKTVFSGDQPLAFHAGQYIGHGRAPDEQVLLQLALQYGFFLMVGEVAQDVAAYGGRGTVMPQPELLSQVPSDAMGEGFDGESNARCCFHVFQTIC